MPSYSPFHKHYIDLDKDIGEKFEPVSDERGFNFATLGQKFDMLVALPGTTYTTKVRITAPKKRNGLVLLHLPFLTMWPMLDANQQLSRKRRRLHTTI